MKKRMLQAGIVLFALAFLFVCYNIYAVYAAQRSAAKAPESYGIFPADADLTVVEFMDYSCSYCQQAHPIITEAIQRDGRVRYIPRPITFNKDAFVAAMLVYQAGAQGHFMAAHNDMITNYKPVDEAALANFSEKFGLDQSKFTGAQADIQNKLQHNIHLFRTLGVRGTPSFLIGPDILYMPDKTMPSVEDFLELFKQVRSQK